MTKTPDEARAYVRARKRASCQVYFADEAEKRRYERMAEAAGVARPSRRAGSPRGTRALRLYAVRLTTSLEAHVPGMVDARGLDRPPPCAPHLRLGGAIFSEHGG